MVEPDTDEGDLERAISAFISTLVSIHNGTYQPGQMEGFDGMEPIGGTVLVTYDCKVSRLVVIDPRPKEIEDTHKLVFPQKSHQFLLRSRGK